MVKKKTDLAPENKALTGAEENKQVSYSYEEVMEYAKKHDLTFRGAYEKLTNS